MSHVSELRKKWMKDPEFRAEYEALHLEFEIMGALIRARTQSGLTQADIAKRMGTAQSAVARLEGGRSNPSMKTLDRFAKATGTRVRIWFEPLGTDRSNDDEDETFSGDVAAEESVEAEKVEPTPVST